MLLKEMFSPLGGPKVDQPDVDWLDDLKFFIDDNEDLISRFIMPAIHKHKQHRYHPAAFKLYIKPLNQCADIYCNKFDLNREEIFPESQIIELAHQMYEQQNKFIDQKNYETD
jgi:hypothetical protein